MCDREEDLVLSCPAASFLGVASWLLGLATLYQTEVIPKDATVDPWRSGRTGSPGTALLPCTGATWLSCGLCCGCDAPVWQG